jgi:hypothetical protein
MSPMNAGELEEICKEAATGIAGAKAFPGGGLLFTRRGFEARVEFSPGQMDILFDTRELAVESIQLKPAGVWHDMKAMFGRKDYEVGDESFDSTFEIHASAGEFAAGVLSPGVRSVLKSAVIFGNFFWRLSPAGFMLRVRTVPPNRKELDRWLVVAFQLLDALPGSDGKGRVTLGVVRMKIDAEAKCRVCGASLAEGGVVSCVKCSTPHHKDCWEFNGRCSTFACGETRSR